MDGGRKKRKLDVARAQEGEEEEDREEEEESEEAKIEKFYELIRSAKNIRARLMINGERMREEEKKKINERKRAAGAWNPTFQPEDFMEDGLCLILCPSRRNNHAGPSNSKRVDHRGREGDGKGGGDGLDLKLSL